VCAWVCVCYSVVVCRHILNLGSVPPEDTLTYAKGESNVFKFEVACMCVCGCVYHMLRSMSVCVALHECVYVFVLRSMSVYDMCVHVALHECACVSLIVYVCVYVALHECVCVCCAP